MIRYRWAKLDEMPPQMQLIDGVTSKAVAVMFQSARRWYWKRNTTVLIHGAVPAQGSAVNLGEAKRQILQGLPDAP